MIFEDLPIGVEFVTDKEIIKFDSGYGAVLTKESPTEYSHTYFGDKKVFVYTKHNDFMSEVYPVIPEE